MDLRVYETCKHCGEDIYKRNEAQGWVHTGDHSRCKPTYATPKEKW